MGATGGAVATLLLLVVLPGAAGVGQNHAGATVGGAGGGVGGGEAGVGGRVAFELFSSLPGVGSSDNLLPPPPQPRPLSFSSAIRIAAAGAGTSFAGPEQRGRIMRKERPPPHSSESLLYEATHGSALPVPGPTVAGLPAARPTTTSAVPLAAAQAGAAEAPMVATRIAKDGVTMTYPLQVDVTTKAVAETHGVVEERKGGGASTKPTLPQPLGVRPVAVATASASTALPLTAQAGTIPPAPQLAEEASTRAGDITSIPPLATVSGDVSGGMDVVGVSTTVAASTHGPAVPAVSQDLARPMPTGSVSPIVEVVSEGAVETTGASTASAASAQSSSPSAIVAIGPGGVAPSNRPFPSQDKVLRDPHPELNQFKPATPDKSMVKVPIRDRTGPPAPGMKKETLPKLDVGSVGVQVAPKGSSDAVTKSSAAAAATSSPQEAPRTAVAADLTAAASPTVEPLTDADLVLPHASAHAAAMPLGVPVSGGGKPSSIFKPSVTLPIAKPSLAEMLPLPTHEPFPGSTTGQYQGREPQHVRELEMEQDHEATAAAGPLSTDLVLEDELEKASEASAQQAASEAQTDEIDIKIPSPRAVEQAVQPTAFPEDTALIEELSADGENDHEKYMVNELDDEEDRRMFGVYRTQTPP